jgi:hydrogenase maturation protease
VIVVGIGNSDRGDDAAGLLVARRLRELTAGKVTIIEHDGEPSALVELFTGHDAVILIDACTGGIPGSVRRFDAVREPLPAETGSPSSHGLGLADAIELARALRKLPARCEVYAIAGTAFARGTPPSGPVERAAETVAQRIADALML